MAVLDDEEAELAVLRRDAREVEVAVVLRADEEAARIFVALGITATDLRLRAKPGSPLRVLADAIETPSGTR